MAKAQSRFGNPANYNTTPATRTDGDASALEVDSVGNLLVGVTNGGLRANVSLPGDGNANSGGMVVVGELLGWNGATWDRLTVDASKNLNVNLNTLIAGEDVTNNVLKVEERFSYNNIVLAAPTTTVVKSGAGFLHSISLNKPVATGTITIYDNTAGSGTVIGTITVPASPQPSTLFYDVTFATGLTIVTATAAQDITVSYR